MAMGCQEFGLALKAVRRLRGWDQVEAGKKLAGLSGRMGQPRAAIPSGTWSTWENGHRYPEPFTAWLLCVLFDMQPEQLHVESIATPELVAGYEKSAQNHAVLEPAPSQIELVSNGHVRDLERLAWMMHGVHQVDATAASDMARISDVLIHQRGHIENRLLLVKLHQHLEHLRQMMERALSPRVGRELAHSAATVAVVAANTWEWHSDRGAAVEMVAYASQLAELAGAGVISAMVDFARHISLTNGCAYDLYGGSRTAIALLDRAEGMLSGDVDPCALTILYAGRGKNWANLGCELEANRDFERAERELACWNSEPTGLFAGMDRTFVIACQGKAASLFGRPAEAIDHWKKALASQTWMAPAYRVNLAASYAQAGLPEQAVPILLSVIDGARSSRAMMFRTWIGNVMRHDLTPFADTPSVKLLREALSG